MWRSIKEKKYFSKHLTSKFRYKMYLNFDVKRFEKYSISDGTSHISELWHQCLHLGTSHISDDPWEIDMFQDIGVPVQVMQKKTFKFRIFCANQNTALFRWNNCIERSIFWNSIFGETFQDVDLTVMLSTIFVPEHWH